MMDTTHVTVPAPREARTPAPAFVSTPQTGHRVVAVASGKGGVGKTWLSIALAQSLAMRGRRVLLVDCDLGLANVDIQLGLMPEHDLTAILAGRRTIPDVILTHKDPELASAAFDILPGRSGAASMASLDVAVLGRLLQALRRLQGYDTVLLDLGAGIDAATRFLSASADTLVVISTDEPTALADAYAVLKLHARDRKARDTGTAPPDVRLVINQCTTQSSGRRTYDALARACETFLGAAPVLAGVIRRDSHVPDSIRRQTTVLSRHPHGQVAGDIARVATMLLR
ncbi:AAA family ATPase [Acetobacteraceae bacterium KSS8]|uniref:AAA family ATPase n=1 Tax=Endosaccharibacter trunci TaxID=2812733 RepID=A0ABT1WB28_9PROT|nr:AAA family ATPase [Acetobacteraceae bacterium KSS8]